MRGVTASTRPPARVTRNDSWRHVPGSDMNSIALTITTASKLPSANGSAIPLACAAITEIPLAP
jgi:hypothetical protein